MPASDKDTEILIKARNLTADAFAEVTKNLEKLATDQKDRNTQAEASWGKLFTAVGAGTAVGQILERGFESALAVVEELPAKILELGQKGTQILGVEQAFDRLTASAGGSKAVLEALTTGVKGTVDDFDLMKIANRSLSDGMKLSADDFGVMAAGARLLAKQTGTDTTEAFDSLNQAMATGRARALNLIGVHIDADAAQARYAATIRKSVDDLTDQDKVAANAAEVMRQLRTRVAEAGDQQLTFGEKLAQARTRLDDWEDEIAKAIATSPALNGAMDVINQAIDRAFGSGQQASVETVTKLIAGTGVAAVKAASFIVEGAREITTAYETARGAVDQLFKAYNDAEIARVQKALDAMREVAATSTSPTSASKLRVQELEVELARLKGASQGYQDDSNDAAAAQERLNSLAKDAQDFLGQLQTQFLKTGAAAKTAGDAGAGAGQKIDAAFNPNKTIQKFVDEARKLADAFDNLEAQIGTEGAVAALGPKFDEARRKAMELGVSLKSLGATFEEDDLAVRAAEFARLVGEQAGQVKSGVGTIFDALTEEADLSGQAFSRSWGLMRDAANDAERRMTEATLTGSQLRLAQIDDEEKKEIASFGARTAANADQYDQRLAATRNFYQLQRDIATGTADTIEIRMREMGIKTMADLDREANDATRDFAQMYYSGKYSADQIQIAYKRMVDACIAATGDWRLVVEKDLGGLSDMIVSSLQGGGGLSGGLKSFAAKESDDFFKTLFDPKDFDTALGSIARAIPGIGAVIGPALSAVLGPLLKKIFGTAGRDAVEAFAAQFNDPGLNNGFDNIQKQLEAIGRNDLWVALTQGVGRNDAEAAKQKIAEVQAALDKVNGEVEKYALSWKDLADPGKMAAGFDASAKALLGTFNDLKAAGYSDSAIVRQMGGDLNQLISDAISTGQKIPPALEPMLETFIRGGGLTDDLKRKLQGLGDTGPSFDDVKNAASSLGVDLDKLGPKVDQLRFTDELEADAKQLKVLQDAGADMGSVYDQMKGKMQDYVTTALKEGLQLPESMKPFIDQMIDAGDLTDDLGNKLTDDSKLSWSKTLNDDVEDLVGAMKDLVDVIKNGVGDALKDVGNTTVRPRIKPYIDDSDLPDPGYGSPTIDRGASSSSAASGFSRASTAAATSAASSRPVQLVISGSGRRVLATAVLEDTAPTLGAYGAARR